MQVMVPSSEQSAALGMAQRVMDYVADAPNHSLPLLLLELRGPPLPARSSPDARLAWRLYAAVMKYNQ